MNKRLTERAIKRLDKIIAFAKSHRWHQDSEIMFAENKHRRFNYVGPKDQAYSYCAEGFLTVFGKPSDDINMLLRDNFQPIIAKRLKNKADGRHEEICLQEYSDYYATSKRCIISLFETTKKNLEKELQDASL